MASIVTSIITRTASANPAATSPALRAAPQGGILDGGNPSKYNPKDPITIFIIQVTVLSLQTK